MCGIAGQLNYIPTPFISEDDWKRLLHHRGPDSGNTYRDKNYQVTHTRLSIIDPSHKSSQPMRIKNITLAFNGEIYNYRELREQLISLGESFSTQGDTEVLLKAYLRFGLSFVEELNGMFAISIWDGKVLHLIRDRIGIKPLYYFEDDKGVLFSSEIKPILVGLKKHVLNTEALDSYLRLRYNCLPDSFYKGIHHVPAGNILSFSLSQKKRISQKKYWEVPQEENTELNSKSRKSIINDFSDKLIEAVKIRTHSDTAMGCFLSGGIDSSSILSLANQSRPDLQAFTLNMGANLDEGSQAEDLAQCFNISHYKLNLSPDTHQDYSSCLNFLEEPLGDSIIVPTSKLAEFASQKVKVVLTGEGADEVLGGYVHHRVLHLSHILKSIFPWVRSEKIHQFLLKLPQPIWESLFPYPHKLGKTGVLKFLNFLRSHSSSSKAYMELLSLTSHNSKSSVDQHLDKIWKESCHKDFLNSLCAFDLKVWNLSYTLPRLDRLTMAHSLEARVPFLDHNLVDFLLSLSRSTYRDLFTPKSLLRESMKSIGLLPKEVTERKKKPFFLPIEKVYPSHFIQQIREDLEKTTNPLFLRTLPQRKFLTENNSHDLFSLKRNFNYFILLKWFELPVNQSLQWPSHSQEVSSR